MRKYYLFIIKDEYYNKYRYSPYLLYKALYYLYKMNKYDLENGLYLYNKFCNIISKNVILNCHKLLNHSYHHRCKKLYNTSKKTPNILNI